MKTKASGNSLSDTKAPIGWSRLFSAAIFPLLLLILGVIGVSSTAIFIKFAVRELSIEAILFDNLLITTIAFASGNWVSQLWQSRRGEKTKTITLGEQTSPSGGMIVVWMISLVILNLTGRSLFMWSMTQTRAVNGLMLSELTPVFTFLGGWLFLRKQFDRRFAVGLGIAVLGALLLTLEDWLQPEEQLFGAMAIVGDGAALMCAMFHAVGMLLVEKLRQRLSTIRFLTWRSVTGLVFVAPLVWVLDDSILPGSATGWLAILGLGLICGVIAHSLIVYSYKHFSSAFIAIVFLVGPLPIAMVAWIFLGEFLSSLNLVGFVLISVGIYLAKTGEGSDAESLDNLWVQTEEKLVEHNRDT